MIDACNSGNSLIKSDIASISDGKGVLNDVIQIASCQSAQFSVTGVPLSLFTKHFCKAALRKPEGPVYYSDIINTLRDDFLEDESHFPHFVSQGSGREKFVDRAEQLKEFRASFDASWDSAEESTMLTVQDSRSVNTAMIAVLEEFESDFVDREGAEAFISRIFDGLIGAFQENIFAEFYDLHILEHSDFEESTARSFIIRNLNNQPRPDNLVTASITRKRKRSRNSLSELALGMSSAFASLYGDDYYEDWHLSLNCELERVQLKMTLRPRYKALNEIRLVVSCAPSLNRCYVFENSTQHVRNDWESFDDQGDQLDRKWYELPWDDDLDWLVNGIAGRIEGATKKHIDATLRRLKPDPPEDEEDGKA